MMFTKSKYILALCILLSGAKMAAIMEMPPAYIPPHREAISNATEAVQLILSALVEYEKAFNFGLHLHTWDNLTEKLNEASCLLNKAFSSRDIAFHAADGALTYLLVQLDLHSMTEDLSMVSATRIKMLHKIMVMALRSVRERGVPQPVKGAVLIEQIMLSACKDTAHEMYEGCDAQIYFKDMHECRAYVRNAWTRWEEHSIIRHYLEVFAWLVLERPSMPGQIAVWHDEGHQYPLQLTVDCDGVFPIQPIPVSK